MRDLFEHSIYHLILNRDKPVVSFLFLFFIFFKKK